MVQPLAMIVYEKILPGTQLVNRLQDMKYRVQAITDADTLVACAEQEKPMLVLADLRSTRLDMCAVIGALRRNPNTAHIPVVAFGAEESPGAAKAALDAGATLVTGETAILTHLPELLEQALRVE